MSPRWRVFTAAKSSYRYIKEAKDQSLLAGALHVWRGRFLARQHTPDWEGFYKSLSSASREQPADLATNGYRVRKLPPFDAKSISAGSNDAQDLSESFLSVRNDLHTIVELLKLQAKGQQLPPVCTSEE